MAYIFTPVQSVQSYNDFTELSRSQMEIIKISKE